MIVYSRVTFARLEMFKSSFFFHWQLARCACIFYVTLLLIKHRSDAFDRTVPCNGVFSGYLAIRFYRLEEKPCVNVSRVCFAPVDTCALH